MVLDLHSCGQWLAGGAQGIPWWGHNTNRMVALAWLLLRSCLR